jgi:hypothetical protein
MKLSKQLQTTIAMVGVCLACAFIALVALFVKTGGMDTMGTSVLMLVLVVFVAFGSAVVVDEYKNEERSEIARTTYDNIEKLERELLEVRGALRNTWLSKYNIGKTLDAVTESRNEYAETLSSIIGERDGLLSRFDNLQMNYRGTSTHLERVIIERDNLRTQLEDARDEVKSKDIVIDEHVANSVSLVNLIRVMTSGDDADKAEALADLDGFLPLENDALIIWYAFTRWNGYAYYPEALELLDEHRLTHGVPVMRSVFD